MFTGRRWATRVIATASLVGTAKLNGLDPEAYLRHVLGWITAHPVNRIVKLLSWNVPTNDDHQRQAASPAAWDGGRQEAGAAA